VSRLAVENAPEKSAIEKDAPGNGTAKKVR
jgi:hypothetical protein